MHPSCVAGLDTVILFCANVRENFYLWKIEGENWRINRVLIFTSPLPLQQNMQQAVNQGAKENCHDAKETRCRCRAHRKMKTVWLNLKSPSPPQAHARKNHTPCKTHPSQLNYQNADSPMCPINTENGNQTNARKLCIPLPPVSWEVGWVATFCLRCSKGIEQIFDFCLAKSCSNKSRVQSKE